MALAQMSDAVSSADLDLCFGLEGWCCHGSGTDGSAWPRGIPPADAELSFLPLLQRRRLSPLARATLSALWPCRSPGEELPTVFCSAHGESQHYVEMLETFDRDGETSPSRFSLTVHNAIAGLYGAALGSLAPCVALAPGDEGPSTALLEAAGWLQENPGRPVLVACYEQPLPEVYQPYAASPGKILALALRLGEPSPDRPWLRLRRLPATDPAPNRQECSLSRLCQAVLGGERRFALAEARAIWQWSLDDA